MEDSDEKKPGEDLPILDYQGAERREPKVIARFGNEVEARMAASKLDGEGIESQVEDRVIAAGMGGEAAQLSVPVEDVKEAIEILKETPARANLIEGK
jgi:hypothetical protein